MNKSDIDSAGKYAALLSMTEVGLGSLLHAWRIPFSGHFLSLNQAFICGKSVRNSESFSPWLALQVSMIAALLKSLSPAGKRLTPMLAISVQGFLYSIVVFVFGTGYLGSLVATGLLALWAFAQPVILYLLVFGKSIFDVGQYFFERLQAVYPVTPEHFVLAFVLLVSFKLVLATLVNHFVFYKQDSECDSYFQGIIANFKKAQPKKGPVPDSQWGKVFLVLKDMLKPWFVISLIMMALFFYLSQPQDVKLFWFMLRPIACGFVVFYILRFLPLDEWLMLRFKNKDSEVFQVFQRAIRYIKELEKST